MGGSATIVKGSAVPASMPVRLMAAARGVVAQAGIETIGAVIPGADGAFAKGVKNFRAYEVASLVKGIDTKGSHVLYHESGRVVLEIRGTDGGVLPTFEQLKGAAGQFQAKGIKAEFVFDDALAPRLSADPKLAGMISSRTLKHLVDQTRDARGKATEVLKVAEKDGLKLSSKKAELEKSFNAEANMEDMLAREKISLEGRNDIQISKNSLREANGSGPSGDSGRQGESRIYAAGRSGEPREGAVGHKQGGSDLGQAGSGNKEGHRPDGRGATVDERIGEIDNRLEVIKDRLNNIRRGQVEIDGQIEVNNRRKIEVEGQIRDLETAERIFSERLANTPINQPLKLTIFPSEGTVSPIDFARNAFPREAAAYRLADSYAIGERMPNGLIAGEGPGAAAVTELPISSEYLFLSRSQLADALNPSGPKRITVLGSEADTKVAIRWGEHNVLRIPTEAWSWELNKQWLDAAIARGDDFYLATAPEKWKQSRPDSTFFTELRYLESLDFKREGNYMVRKK